MLRLMALIQRFGSLNIADEIPSPNQVGGRVFFAGEATTKKHPATMHGAFLSGQREVRQRCSRYAAVGPGQPCCQGLVSS